MNCACVLLVSCARCRCIASYRSGGIRTVNLRVFSSYSPLYMDLVRRRMALHRAKLGDFLPTGARYSAKIPFWCAARMPFSPHCGLMYPQGAAKAVTSFLLLYFSTLRFCLKAVRSEPSEIRPKRFETGLTAVYSILPHKSAHRGGHGGYICILGASDISSSISFSESAFSSSDS